MPLNPDDIRARAEAVGYGWAYVGSGDWELRDSGETFTLFVIDEHYQAALDLVEAEERRQARCEGCDGKGYTETTMESGMVIAKPCRGCKGTGERP